MALGFLRNFGMDYPQEAGFICFLREIRTVIYVDESTKQIRTPRPLMHLSESAHESVLFIYVLRFI